MNNNSNKKEMLHKIHNIHLEMLKLIDFICRENNINYCLAFGSALGAVRHNGAIPWDDDADIVMEYSDYIKFKKIFINNYSKDYFLQDPKTEKESPFVFAKLRKNNTYVLDKTANGLNMHEGIWIDIFILIDGCKTGYGLKVQDFFAKVFQTLRCRYRYLNNKDEYKVSIIKKILYRVPSPLFSLFENTVLGLIRLLGSSKSEYYYMLSNTGFERSCYKKNWYDISEYHKYEKTEFLIPKDYDDYLISLYGEYMKPVKYYGHFDTSNIIFDVEDS